MVQRFDKDPAAVKPYGIDWAGVIGGDTITDVDVTAAGPSGDPDGLTVGATDIDGAVTTAVLSGGTPNHNYLVTFHITTDGALEDERSILIVVGEQ